MTKAEVDGVVAALDLMMRLRDELVYRGRGWLLLNAACQRLTDRFWNEVGEPRPPVD